MTPWPPPPHDPRERVVLAAAEGWELRDFAPEDARAAYFAAHGFAHLQLWHPARGVSILTPSRLTGGRYELYPFAGWKRAARRFSEVQALVEQAHGLRTPGETQLLAWCRWFALPPALEPAA